jgi:hypothetical protein
MKKTLLSLIACLTIASYCEAQEEAKGYFGVSLGPSIPLNDFASSNSSNEDAAFATNGAIFDVSFAYKLGNGNFGITGLLRGQANLFNTSGMEDALSNLYGNSNWTVESDGWSQGALMLGGFGSFPISDKATFNMRGMIGYMAPSSPDITITSTSNLGNIWIKQSRQTIATIGYLLGAGFNFSISDKLYVLTSLDMMNTNAEFNNVEITASDGSRDLFTYTQKIQTLNIGIGIGFKL